jgi:hypothetical protein
MKGGWENRREAGEERGDRFGTAALGMEAAPDRSEPGDGRGTGRRRREVCLGKRGSKSSLKSIA